jgi:hypothetical protein
MRGGRHSGGMVKWTAIGDCLIDYWLNGEMDSCLRREKEDKEILWRIKLFLLRARYVDIIIRLCCFSDF